MRFRVKVCGITRPQDATLAAQLGADMIGMIFYRQSPRCINRKQANAIVNTMPPFVGRVGVFVDTEVDSMLERAGKLRLDFIQLQGKYGPGDVSMIQREGFKVIRAFHVKTKQQYKTILQSKADLLLLDNKEAGVPGGTGRRFDWKMSPAGKIPNLVLAGGLHVDNVEEGIRIFSPAMVDVCSGVEASPGIKSPTKLRRFLELCNKLRYGK